MEMAGFRSIKKPVILEIPTIIIATPTGTDINFLKKMQKMEIRQNEIFIAISEKTTLPKLCPVHVNARDLQFVTGK